MNYTGALQAMCWLLLAACCVISESNIDASVNKLTNSHQRASRATENKPWAHLKSIVKRAAEQIQKTTANKADVAHKRVRRMGFPIPGIMTPWLQQNQATPPPYYPKKKPSSDETVYPCDCSDYYYYDDDELPEEEDDSSVYYYDEGCYDYCLDQYHESADWDEDTEGTGVAADHPERAIVQDSSENDDDDDDDDEQCE